MASQSKPTKPTDSTPRWIPVTGALVGIGTLIWAVAGHFIKGPDSPAVPQTATASCGTATANSGGGLVLNFGSTPASCSTAPASTAASTSTSGSSSPVR